MKEQFSGLRPILCANLPYHITTPFLTACVEAQCFDSLTVLIQKEVAQRICAAPGTADYGAFTLLMQYYTQPELLFTVSNTCFLPAPKVTSAVIHCRQPQGSARWRCAPRRCCSAPSDRALPCGARRW